jgi:hypothetical protein
MDGHMIEWEVLEDERLPEDIPEAKPPRKPLPWKPILAVVLVLAVVTMGGVAWRLRVVEEQVRTDIEQLVLREERAIRLGISEQAIAFADPDAPLAWKGWYQSIYTPSELPLPTPMIESVEQAGDVALVVAKYEMEGYVWRNARAYRLTEEAWRRTPIPRTLWDRREAHRSDFFMLEMNALEEELVPPEPLAEMLETFRTAWSEAWLIENATPLKITFSPDETLNEPEFSLQQITLRSPLLNPTPTFAAPNACSLGILETVARVYSGELYATGEDEYLRVVMRDAVLEELTQSTNGVCQVVEQATVLPASALGLPPNFGDYLVRVGGIGAAYTFIQNAIPDLDLDRAAQAATGHPMAVLQYGATEYPTNPNATQIQAAGTLSGGINYGEIVRGIVGDDMTVQVRERQGVTVEISLSGTMQAVAASGMMGCFQVGSQVAYTWEANTKVRDIRLLSRPVDRIGVTNLPPVTRLIYQQEREGTTYVYAQTAERDTVELFHVAESVQIVPHPTTQALAFLSHDGCGWVLNEYNGKDLGDGDKRLQRWSIPVEPERVIWVGNQAAVVVQTEDEWARDYWQVYLPAEPAATESPLERAEELLSLAAGNQGRLLGYSPARPGFLISDDHALHWTVQDDDVSLVGGEVATLPYRFADNVEYSALSFDGRWLAYTVYPTDGRSDLNVLDTFENEQIYLNTIPIDQAGGETRWGLGDTPSIAFAVGDLGLSGDSDMSIHLYEISENGEGYQGHTYFANGEIDQLRWCSVEPEILTFRETTEVGSRNLTWNGLDSSTPLTEYDEADRILWCP